MESIHLAASETKTSSGLRMARDIMPEVLARYGLSLEERLDREDPSRLICVSHAQYSRPFSCEGMLAASSSH